MESFNNSVCMLAQLAMRETAAAGFAFFKRSFDSATLVRQAACGVAIEEDALRGEAYPWVARYPLRRGEDNDAVLAFAFESSALLKDARSMLTRIAAAINAVWDAAPEAGTYAGLIHRVAELEAQLNDSKITDRVRGFLENPGEPDVIEAIATHVYRVLRPAETRRILERMQLELEEELKTRALAARAKEILQSAHAMSEAEAYAHLHRICRRSRRRLKDVAEELIAQQVIERGTA